MFWKRKQNKDVFFVLEANDKRLGFRVLPHEDFPAEVRIEDRPIELVNIGAGGVAFNNVGLKKNNRHSVFLSLAGYKTIIQATICIINIDINNVCHCYFSEILEKDVDAIHKYVLDVQKIELREKKNIIKDSLIS